jgi:hypothetical protein
MLITILQILLVLDRQAQCLNHTTVRITGLEFGANASSEFRLAMGRKLV